MLKIIGISSFTRGCFYVESEVNIVVSGNPCLECISVYLRQVFESRHMIFGAGRCFFLSVLFAEHVAIAG